MKQDDPAHAIGQAIRARRTAAGVSQDQFADRIGMHRAYYSAIERGEKNLTLLTLGRITAGLGCSLAALAIDADL
ncbi:helix-turn-helix transcriptional regulator [Oleiagrimonas sp. C23AA]|uniref:helix-turn-helix domain-containing protein n=1 Tax=Oleiagrimonas sp. C23AA TaxID=2719047 RepID=UPI0014247CE3|nr:helix-turn-helix transcriptional regulator [Oleiagrimonas sp. C23AA]NII10670.1 helix-turn-helix transcriptional regulator [Oleiagrimonas sp. C23AA]